MRSAETLRAALVLALASCGARTSLRTDLDAGPPPPATCASATAAIEWGACENLPGPDRRTAAAITCAHETATRGCETASVGYWSCLAGQHAACVAYDAGTQGTIGTNVPAPACDAALQQMTDCLAKCNASYVCEGEGWTDCRCSDSAPCSVYPASSSLPDCNVVCSACE